MLMMYLWWWGPYTHFHTHIETHTVVALWFQVFSALLMNCVEDLKLPLIKLSHTQRKSMRRLKKIKQSWELDASSGRLHGRVCECLRERSSSRSCSLLLLLWGSVRSWWSSEQREVPQGVDHMRTHMLWAASPRIHGRSSSSVQTGYSQHQLPGQSESSGWIPDM